MIGSLAAFLSGLPLFCCTRLSSVIIVKRSRNDVGMIRLRQTFRVNGQLAVNIPVSGKAMANPGNIPPAPIPHQLKFRAGGMRRFTGIYKNKSPP